MPRPPSDRLLAAVEGGGTKFVCAVGHGPDAIVDRVRIPTTTPDETLARVIDFLAPHRPVAVGVGMFGPLVLDESAGERRGSTSKTPKPGWDHVPVRARLEEALAAPVVVDTDVNAAALAESLFGDPPGLDPLVYLTVGTGIGGGVVVGGKPLHGLMHPEVGHVRVPPMPLADGTFDPFAGVCPFHGRCLEGMASGTALNARVGGGAEGLAEDHPAWELEARYLAHGLAALVLILSPRRIVLGGGVMANAHLFPRIRRALSDELAGYVDHPALTPIGLDHYVVPSRFDAPGLAGAFALAGTAV